jgi:hypothetical protein
MTFQTLRPHAPRSIAPLFAASLTAALLSFTMDPAAAQRRTYQRSTGASASRVTLPVGTVLPVRLDQAVSSRTSSEGDQISATVITGNDDAGLPEGTRLEGVVREALAAENGKPGVMDVDFRRMVLPNGRTQAVDASLYSLNGKAVKRTDGRLTATGDRSKDRLKWVGIGAAGGLVLSKVTKTNSIVGTLLGAGAGYLYNELGSKAKPGDIDIKEGAEFGLRLDRQVAFDGGGRQAYRQSADSRYGDDARESRETGSGYTSSRDIRVLVNGRAARFEANAQPFVQNGALFVPLAAMGRAAEFDVRYDEKAKVLFARDDSVRLPMGSRTLTANGERHTMPASAVVRGGVTFVPVQFVTWAADGSVNWNPDTRTVTIRTQSN